MANTAPRPSTGSRSATRALRRQQLIQSTIESIARRGFADTTLANVAAGAGLSRGIVNFHFRSKDQLLVFKKGDRAKLKSGPHKGRMVEVTRASLPHPETGVQKLEYALVEDE